MIFYHIAMFVLRVYYKIMFRVTIIGLENVPATGNAVLCCNHTSNYDPITMAVCIKRLPRYIAKKELFDKPVLRPILNSLKAFPVDRNAVMDMKAFKMAINVLKSGEMLGIFAEGTRVKDGDAGAAKAGVALFAMKGNAPVIPVCITGEHSFRGRITIEYGVPMPLDEYRGQKLNTELMNQITAEIMEHIEEMKQRNG